MHTCIRVLYVPMSHTPILYVPISHTPIRMPYIPTHACTQVLVAAAVYPYTPIHSFFCHTPTRMPHVPRRACTPKLHTLIRMPYVPRRVCTPKLHTLIRMPYVPIRACTQVLFVAHFSCSYPCRAPHGVRTTGPCPCVRVWVRAYMCACVRACVCVCVRERVCVRALCLSRVPRILVAERVPTTNDLHATYTRHTRLL